jgi:rod shape determining protein RodA
LLFHIVVNLAMTIGLFPVIGIPLPFISYGGSAMWAFTAMVFLLLRMQADRV